MNKFNGTKVPFPDNIGSGTLVPQKETPSKGEAKASLPKNIHSHLPHIDVEGYYQFITFRTYDSVDEYLKRVFDSDLENSKKQYKIDDYLDSSQNGAYLNGKVLQYLYEFLLSKDNILYRLISFVIMPNHIHILCKPHKKLSQVMQSIKGITAREINLIMNKKGKFWANDYYDKAIRDEKHFWTTCKYIKNNCLKLCEAKASLPNEAIKDVSKTLVPPLNNDLILKTRFYGVYDA